MQKIKVKVHKLNRLRKGRGRVKTSPSARLVNYRDAGSSQPHLLSQNFILGKNIERTRKNKSGRRSFILGGRKASGHDHAGPGGRWLSQESCTFVLFVPAQQGNGCMAFCQSVKPLCSPRQDSGGVVTDISRKVIFCV